MSKDDEQKKVLDFPLSYKESLTMLDAFFDLNNEHDLLQTPLSVLKEQLKIHAQPLIERNPNPERQADILRFAIVGLKEYVKIRKANFKQVQPTLMSIDSDAFKKLTGSHRIEKLIDHFDEIYKYDDDYDVTSTIVRFYYDEGVSIPDSIVRAVINTMSHKRRKKNIATLNSEISYDGTPFEEALLRFKTFFKYAVDPKCLRFGFSMDRYSEILAHVMIHFVWQTKRKLKRMKLEHHMIPTFLSKGGAGKSETIELFLGPIKKYDDFYSKTDLQALTHEAHQLDGFRNFILFFDEMEKGKDLSMEGLKRNITQDRVGVRIFKTQGKPKVNNNATGIAASNVDKLAQISQQLHDERRFFPALIASFVRIAASQDDLKLVGHLTDEQIANGFMYPLEGFDALAFWKMVDEKAPCRIPVSDIRSIQANDGATEGLEEFSLSYSMSPGAEYFPCRQIHQLYLEMMVRSGRRKDALDYEKFVDGFCRYMHSQHPDSYNKVNVNGLQIKFKQRARVKAFRDVQCFMLRSNLTLSSATKNALDADIKDGPIDDISSLGYLK